MNVVDICIASGAHEAAKADLVKWEQLPRVGVQEDGEGSAWELRNCPACCSTLALNISEAA